jgi:nitroimidazol reductase NimA-like FMN-containing flavoprotein (pyridoxamine 5'-phosphate oxidase superfamily)
MAVVEGRTFLEVLTPIACSVHLRQEDVGRVAVMVDGHPEIFPVNYAVDDGGDIFFRTDPGSKLDAVATAPTIAFEIDGLDEERHSGWSVLAVGPARWLAGPEQMAHARTLPLQPWAAGEKANVVRLSPTKLSGRRIYRPTMSNRHAPVV